MLGVAASVSLWPVAALGREPRAEIGQAAAAGQTLLPVVLPDVSRLHESVQRQLREAYASLMADESSADAFGQMGMLFMATRFSDDARVCFQNAQRLAPENARWSYYLGHVLKNAGDLSGAAESFERTRALQPADVTTLVWLGRVYLDLGEPVEAEARLADALALEPDQPAARFELGWAALAQQDYARAVEHLTAAAALDPDATVIHYPLALAYRGLGDLDQATHHFELRGGSTSGGRSAGVAFTLPDPLLAALNGSVRTPQFYRDRGLDAAAGGNWPQAVEYYRRALEAEPDYAAMRVNLGTALERVGDARGARFGEAMALVRLERYAEARERLTEALTVRPDVEMFGHALARLLAAAPDDLVRDGERAWELVAALPEEEQHPAVFETMAMVLAELGHFELALDWQRLAMSSVARAGRSDVAQQMAMNLARYEARQPCRTPWRDDDPDHRPGPLVDPALLSPPLPR